MSEQHLATLGDIVERFDLTKREDVDRMAQQLGQQWCDALVAIGRAIPEEHLGHFWAYVFAQPFGAMSRAIGMENTDAVVAAIVETCRALCNQPDRVKLAGSEPANKLPA